MWRVLTNSSDMNSRISGTYFETAFHEFIYNSSHFPLALILAELLVYESTWHHKAMMIFILHVAVLLQVLVLASIQTEKQRFYILGNLIGPFTVGILGIGMFGIGAFDGKLLYFIYVVFAFGVGVTQEVQNLTKWEILQHVFILLENFLRAQIPLVAYLLFDTNEFRDLSHWRVFISDPSHLFLLVVFPLFGLKMGLGNINHHRYRHILKYTAQELKRYTEWFFGPQLFQILSSDPSMLNLSRKERTVVFSDIRGFTKWSEDNSPEQVVALINQFYDISDHIFGRYGALKWDFTGDEVLAIFKDPRQAVQAALIFVGVARPVIRRFGLDIGTGINSGQMYEGLLGGDHIRKYTVLGDEVNTGKRICDVANGGEVLISERIQRSLGKSLMLNAPRLESVKGKRLPLLLFPVTALRHPTSGASAWKVGPPLPQPAE